MVESEDANGQAASIEIFNNNGQRMNEAKMGAWEGQLQMDATGFASGNY